MAKRFHENLKESLISDVYVDSYENVLKEIKEKDPEIIINCAGKTGIKNIDWCEDNKIETIKGNIECPLILLKATEELNKYFVHIGSGCVYQGDNNGKGFSEEDKPNFEGSFYIRTKITTENILKDFPVLQLRIKMPADSKEDNKNLITKLSRYNKILDVENSITIVKDAIYAAKILMDKRKTGIYNLVNPGVIKNTEILAMYKEIVDSNIEYEVISENKLLSIVKADRSNCMLNTDKLKNEHIILPDIKESIKNILEEYIKNV